MKNVVLSAFSAVLLAMTASVSAAPAKLDSLVLGGGCFWCTEAVFQRIRGVLRVESGYCNGRLATRPSYEDVCRGDTGFNEVVQLGYDPQVIGLARLLDVFFAIHDPTSLNRQGHDVGTQYRSGIYVSHTDDLALVQAYIDDLRASQVFNQPIVTEVLPLTHYWPAEDYHQNYFVNHPNQGYCAFVVAPKVKKFLQTFADKVRS